MHFGKKEFELVGGCYTAGINICEERSAKSLDGGWEAMLISLQNNRAAATLGQIDAEMKAQAPPEAKFLMSKLKLAKVDLEAVLVLDTMNAKAIARLAKVKKIMAGDAEKFARQTESSPSLDQPCAVGYLDDVPSPHRPGGSEDKTWDCSDGDQATLNLSYNASREGAEKLLVRRT